MTTASRRREPTPDEILLVSVPITRKPWPPENISSCMGDCGHEVWSDSYINYQRLRRRPPELICIDCAGRRHPEDS